MNEVEQGSTLALADGSGTLVAGYAYDPYGKTVASGNPGGNAFAYTGREDDGTGLYYYRARYYHPGLGRFVSEDPIGLAGGANLYSYVGGNPVRDTDPMGLMPPGADPECFRTGTCQCATAECAAGLSPIRPPSPKEMCIKRCTKARWPVCGITAGSGVPGAGPICTGGMFLICNAQCDNPGPPTCQISDITAP